MAQSPARTFMRLSRLATCTFAFLVVLLSYYVFSENVLESIKLATPLLPITMATFILNDINDFEKDQINHPDRPLPSQSIAIKTAAIMYIFLFVFSIVIVCAITPPRLYYIYFIGLALGINYSTIVNHFPIVKNPYVALTTVLPFFLVNSAAESEIIQHWYIAAAFMFVFSREALMDVRDWAGDGRTLAKHFTSQRAVVFAFVSQLMTSVLLVPIADNNLRKLSLAAIALLTFANWSFWHSETKRCFAYAGMKLQAVISVAFLIKL